MKKKNILKKLQKIIGWFDEHKHELGILSSEKDFTRASRKMSFIDVIYSVIGLKYGKTKNELIDYFECCLNTITSVGYYLARCKVKPEAFHMILKKINETFKAAKRIREHRLIAFDGSDLLTYTDKDDYETHSSLREGSKGCNMVHINAAYDALNNIYVDVEVQTLRNKNETGALIEMIKRTDIEKGAIIRTIWQSGWC